MVPALKDIFSAKKSCMELKFVPKVVKIIVYRINPFRCLQSKILDFHPQYKFKILNAYYLWPILQVAFLHKNWTNRKDFYCACLAIKRLPNDISCNLSVTKLFEIFALQVLKKIEKLKKTCQIFFFGLKNNVLNSKK